MGYHYSYPPTLLLLTAPLAFIPYIPALVLWLSAGWFAFYRALRIAMPEGRTLLLALATPAVFVNFVAGQNGTWTAALFGAGLGFLDRRPVLAGGLSGTVGLQTATWHFDSGGACRWQALAGLRYRGSGQRRAHRHCSDLFWSRNLRRLSWSAGHALRHLILEDGTGVWHRMLSVFVAARRLGADVPTAYFVQAIAAASLRSPSRQSGSAARPLASEMRRCCLAPVWRRRICRITIWYSARWWWSGSDKTRTSGACRNCRCFLPMPRCY